MSAGWRSPGLRSATLPTAVSGLSHCHRPVRSGLPSAVRGAGAVRFGLPSAVRGMPGAGCFSHCASRGVLVTDKMSAKKTRESLMVVTSLHDSLHDVIAVLPGRWRSKYLDTPCHA